MCFDLIKGINDSLLTEISISVQISTYGFWYWELSVTWKCKDDRPHGQIFKPRKFTICRAIWFFGDNL